MAGAVRDEAVHACEMVRLAVVANGGSPATAYMAAALLAWELEDPEKRPLWPRKSWGSETGYPYEDAVNLAGRPVPKLYDDG